MKADVADPFVKHVPTWASQPAKAELTQLEKMKKEFTKCVEKRGGTAVSSTMEEIIEVVKSAQEASALLAKMLASAKQNVKK